MKAEERAQQVWQILTGAARNRQVLTYEIVGQRIGVPARGLGHILGHIMLYCERHGLPPLTALVVRKETGLPGEGLTTVGDLGKDREAVFELNWDELLPPSARDFEAAIGEAPDSEAIADFS